jgi:hypothetical protein
VKAGGGLVSIVSDTCLVFAFGFPPSGFRFQRFSFLLNTQVSESSSVTARSLLLGLSIAYAIPSQSSNVR